ncbi:MAG: LUD domain-containing protein [Deltaproteobacteria bacterium]|nr:LUD domain-containing protein [Deltaproteobacteria bacterium]MBW2177104.1 LUD domain-containing protein [Deltaproteobacteria bacterium]MBW2611102.1 LUD domain-containing protein [Deltaproteobacteria bacterium]MBW2633252.1 LUD domain-containing protein [Deltaproteobacteria bacterium]MBW2676732.1 LUD domain-containing protein [Deltaproteobacteria bacterium]
MDKPVDHYWKIKLENLKENLDKKTPCVKTASCHECKSPDRICNTWTITQKLFPKGRIKVILLNQDPGL